MKIVHVEEKQITGMSIRTKNSNEFDPESAKIANLYKAFDNKFTVDYKNGARVYGIYYNYESDASGEFSVLAGTDQTFATIDEQTEVISIPSGSYMVFEAKGEIPQSVITCWTNIWGYFSNDGVEYQRAYTKDFEFYKNQNEVEIHISIK